MSDVNEFNVSLNQFVLREYNTDELKQREKEINNSPVYSSTEIELDQKIISSLNKLQSLGLTLDEAKVILGL
ncbi:MAG: hypothetical protein EB127_06680 [Alphaproteobacteria bacterium]|nr:hypothetical protein [Alphaproteobacteria bacterium]